MAPARRGPELRSDTEQQLHLGCTRQPGRTPCGDQPERATPSCSPFGARMHLAGARRHRSDARRASTARPKKGGAVPIRTALATAVAVTVVTIPAALMSLFSSDPAVAQAARHQAVSSHRGADTPQPERISDKLMSYSQARKVAQMVNYANAVQAAQQATFFKNLAIVAGGRCPGEHDPGRMDADRHLRGGRSQRPERRVLRHPRMASFRGLPDRRQRSAERATGLGGPLRRRTTRRTGAVPQLLSISGLPPGADCFDGRRYPASNMAVTCAMSK